MVVRDNAGHLDVVLWNNEPDKDLKREVLIENRQNGVID